MLRSALPALLSLLALVSGLACNAILGFEAGELRTDGAGGQGGSAPLPLCGDDGAGRCFEVPPGWSGPAVVSEVTLEGVLPECPGGVAPTRDGFRELSVTGGCAPCACEALCNLDLLQLYDDPGCGGSSSSTGQVAGCHDLPGAPPESALAAMPITECSTAGGESNLETSWQWQARLCAALPSASGSCDAGDCYATEAAPFLQQLCIWRDGATACPSGFANMTYYGRIDDTHSCTSCECTLEQHCVALSRFYANDGCTGAMQDVSNDSICHAMNPAQSMIPVITFLGGCSVSQDAALQGGAVPNETTAYTVCCAP